MLFAILMLAGSPSPVCEKLDHEFHSSEKTWAVLSKADQSYLDSMRMMAKEVGGDYHLKVREAREELDKTNNGFAERTDRLMTLMIAQKCVLPDHVASPFNHQGIDRSSE